MSWQPFARTDEIAGGQGLSRKLGAKRIVVFEVEGKYYAMHDQCPHAGAPLSDGSAYVDDVDGLPVVLCPLHYWVFSLEDGSCPFAPSMRTEVYDVKVEDGQVWVASEPRQPELQASRP